MSTGNIKIDQLRFNIPYDAVNDVSADDSKLPPEVRTADRIFRFSLIFNNGNRSYGHNGYTSAYVWGSGDTGKISVMWNPDQRNMGVSIDFTATGKAIYESLGPLYGVVPNWQRLIRIVCEDYKGHLSRIDIATDLIDYGFSVDKIYRALSNNEYVFLNSLGNRIGQDRYQTVGSISSVETLYVGSRKSDAFLRIYDKKTEQSRTGAFYRGVALSCQDWIRVEAEFKHRLAKKIGLYISSLDEKNIYPYLVGCVLERWSLVIERKT